MEKSENHTRHYWIRHKDGYLFCGICKKKRDSTSRKILKNDLSAQLKL